MDSNEIPTGGTVVEQNTLGDNCTVIVTGARGCEPAAKQESTDSVQNKKSRYKLITAVIVGVVVVILIGLSVGLGVGLSHLHTGKRSTQATGPPSTLPSSTSPVGTPFSVSSTASRPPPIVTADGVYLCNYDSSSTGHKGSLFAYYKTLDLDRNISETPDGVAFAAVDEVAEWELVFRTGTFTDTDTNFTSYVNVSTETAATLAINGVAGYAMNGNAATGALFRNFIIYKHAAVPLYNDSRGSQVFPEYFAA